MGVSITNKSAWYACIVGHVTISQNLIRSDHIAVIVFTISVFFYLKRGVLSITKVLEKFANIIINQYHLYNLYISLKLETTCLILNKTEPYRDIKL